jgi:8-oxo-dGTP diphosphatase
MEYVNYVNGFMINPVTRDVLFIKKNRPTFQVGKWNGIGGKLEKGESPIEAMVREFREETGVVTAQNDWEHTITLTGKGDEGVGLLLYAGFKVHFYRMFVEKMPDFHQMTDEYVAVGNLAYLYRDDFPTLDNMKWILPLQFNMNVGFPLSIQWCRLN